MTMKVPATVECLRAVGPDRFVIDFHLTENAVRFSPILTRLEAAKLSTLISEGLRRTQDQVEDPEQLAQIAEQLL